MIRPFLALAFDVPRRMSRGKVFWIFAFLCLLTLCLAFALSVRKAESGKEYLTWFGQPDYPPPGFPPIRDELQDFLMQLFGFLTLYAGVLSGLVIFSDVATNAFAPGSAELNVPKPIHRGAIVAARHLGAVLMASGFALLEVGGAVTLTWLKTGVFVSEVLWVIPISILLFAVLHAVGTIGSLATQNAFFGVLMSIGAWVSSYGTDLLAKKLPALGAMKVLEHAGKFAGIAHRLLPRASDLRDLLDRLISGTFGSTWLVDRVETGGTLANPCRPRVYGRLESVSPRVHLVRNVVNSSVVIGERGVAVVDTQVNRAMARRLLAAVRAVTEKPILFAINTHYHWDHTNGNAVFQEAGATLVCGEKTKRFMAERAPRQKAFLASRGFSLGPDPELPRVTFDGSLELDLGGQRLRLTHLGTAETDDANAVHLPDEGLVCSGDTVMTGSFPIFGQPVMNEGLMDRSWLATLARIRALEPRAVLPGHGPLARAAELDLLERIEEFFLKEVGERVGRGLELTALLDDLERALPPWIKELAEVWGTPRYAALRVWRGLVNESEPGWQHRKPSAIPSADARAVSLKTASLDGPLAYASCAREAIEGGDVALAVAVAREGSRRFPGDARAWVALGRALMDGSRTAASVLEKGDFFVEAKASWERAQALDPAHGPAHLLEGQMLVMTAYRNGDDTRDGEVAVRRALELSLDSKDGARAKFLLGLAARTRGDEKAALAFFQEAVAGDPSLFPARLALG
ncbi:MBL fold metallo-hydrolase [bacterium]|nr:MBL fold metallo-hydrolase [bacterium]